MSVSSIKLHHFLKDGLTLKFGFSAYMFKLSVIFSVRSTSESCMLFICVVFVSILSTYLVVCEFRYTKLFDVVYLFQNQKFLKKSCVNLFPSVFMSIGKTENHF